MVSCKLCGETMDLDNAGGLRMHTQCVKQYDRQTLKHVVGIMVTLGILGLILISMVGFLALAGVAQ